MAVDYYPLDFDVLGKGDSFTPIQLEEITGKKRDTKEYQFAVLQLCQRIMRELSERGNPVTAALRRDCLCILTDEEASIHNAKRFRANVRGLFRSHTRNMAVDSSQLGAESRKQHERAIAVNGAVLVAMKEARQLAIREHRRSTPGIR